MTWRTSGTVLLAAVAAVSLSAAEQNAQRAPVFRSRATAVSFDVSVKRGNRAVAGLTAADFTVTDNGVAQTVEWAFTDRLPVDVTLVIDTSGSIATILDDIRRNAQRILGLLRPDDRARVLIIGTRPYELVPLKTVDKGLVLAEQRVLDQYARMYGGYSSINDAILAGLVARPDGDRRRLVAAITDGRDNRSITSVQGLERVARRSHTVLHFISVVPEGGLGGPGGGAGFGGFGGGAGSGGPGGAPGPAGPGPARGFMREEPSSQERDLLETLPALTGGAFHGPSLDKRNGRNINVVATIRDVIEEFRQSYVIQYTPRDVAAGGWHDVVVRVKGVDGKGVRTRAGYFGAVR